MNLFIRPPESLDYEPKFSREEVRLNYKDVRVRIGGGLGSLEGPGDEPQYATRHEITILGYRYESYTRFYREKISEIPIMLANEFLSKPANKTLHPEAWQCLIENGTELSNSRRYWDAVEHREEIERTRQNALHLLDQCRRAEWVASMYAVQVKAERWLSTEEKALLLAEFSGGEYGQEKS